MEQGHIPGGEASSKKPTRRFLRKPDKHDDGNRYSSNNGKLKKMESSGSLFKKGWNIDDHRISVAILCSRYRTDAELGLNEEQVSVNRTKYGNNTLKMKQGHSELLKFLSNIFLGLNLLFWAAVILRLIGATIQISMGDTDEALDSIYDAVPLILVILIAGCFSYYQEYSTNKTMQSFRNMAPETTVAVTRGGLRQEVASSDLVVGDIVHLCMGDTLPADVRILECSGLYVDNSSITGESEAQFRSSECTDVDPMETKNLAFYSTFAVQGNAKCVVVKVGDSTLMASLAELAASVNPTKTPLAKEMKTIVILLTVISLVFGAAFLMIGISLGYSLLDTMYLVMNMIIGNIPENLNIQLTVILALAAKKLSKSGCLVKHLHSVETLGSASVICSDKTGTLTQNKMSVAHIFSNGLIVDADANSGQLLSSQTLRDILKVGILCNRAQFMEKSSENGDHEEELDPVSKRQVHGGDSSEAAIIRWAEETMTGCVNLTRRQFPTIFEIPFNSVNKYQLSLHENGDEGYYAAMKGAPERILDMCSTVLSDNTEQPLDVEQKAMIQKACNELAALGERVLAFCDLPGAMIRPSEEGSDGISYDEKIVTGAVEGKMRFLGLLSLIDPPRPEVPEAVRRCKAAGIKVAMVTGDHPITARAIAQATNIITSKSNIHLANTPDLIGHVNRGFADGDIVLTIDQSSSLPDVTYKVITGIELNLMCQNDIEREILSTDELVFARTSPSQKHEIVKAYQALGYIVASTGDGVNDSPALKRADVGIAMGSGTEVAKEVSDLVLLDDKFSSIVLGVEEGRVIYENLKKVLRFTMSDNVAEMYCYWFYILLKVPLPLGTTGMILSTLGADVFPAVGLAHEPTESHIMKLPPRKPESDTLFPAEAISFAYGQVSVIELCGGFFAYFVTFGYNGWLLDSLLFNHDKYESPAINDMSDSYGQEWTYNGRMKLSRQAQTAFFLSIVLCQFCNAICCKTRRRSVFQHGLCRNKLMMAGLVAMIVFPCIFIYTPFVNSLLSFVPLKLETWISCVPFALLLFLYDEGRKWVVRSKMSSWATKEFLV